MLRAARAGDFPGPRALDPSIDRAMEAVCLKAMANRPEDRYATPRALADDVDRWAADEPVSAREESRGERLSRWARRHRSATRAAAACLLVVALTAGAVAFLINAAREATVRALDSEADARRLAEGQSGLALDAVREYYPGVSRDFQLKQPEMEVLRKSLLRSPLKFFERLAANLATNARVDRAMRVRLGEAQFDLGKLISDVESRPASIPAFEQALAVQEGLVRERPGSADDQYRMTRTRLELANKYELALEPVEARAAFDRVLADASRLEAEHPGDRRFLSIRAEGLQLRANFRWDNNDLEGARRDMTEAARMGGNLLKDHPDDLQLIENQGNTLNDLYILHGMDAGINGPAEATPLESIALRERLAKLDPSKPMYRSDVSSAYMNMAAPYQDHSRNEEALAWTGRALELQRPLVAEDPNHGVVLERLGSTLGNLSAIEQARDRLDQAAEVAREATEIDERLVRPRNGQTQPLVNLAQAYTRVADIEKARGKYEEAAPWADRAVATAERGIALAPDRHDIGDMMGYTVGGRGEDYRDHGRPVEAIRDLERSVAIFRKLCRDFPEILAYRGQLGHFLGSLALARRMIGQPERAEGEFREAIEIHRRRHEAEPGLLSPALNLSWLQGRFAELLAVTGREAEALSLFDRAIARFGESRRLEPSNPSIPGTESEVLAGRADLLSRMGRHPEALRDADHALRIALAKDRPDLALRRARDLARAGSIDGDLGVVQAEGPEAARDERLLVGMAAVHAAIAGSTARSGLGDRVEADSARAMDRLRAAHASPAYREPIALRVELDDPAFDPLRAHPDFQDLILDLCLPAQPFGE